MKYTFVGPSHRVQMTVSVTADESRERLFRVDALPRAAHRSTAYVRGEHLYCGPSARQAWESVLRLVPAAQTPVALQAELSTGIGLSLCPYCNTAVRSHHRQTQIPWPVAHPGAQLRAAHVGCVTGEIRIDPKLI